VRTPVKDYRPALSTAGAMPTTRSSGPVNHHPSPAWLTPEVWRGDKDPHDPDPARPGHPQSLSLYVSLASVTSDGMGVGGVMKAVRQG
jgi:hypothetical protein